MARGSTIVVEPGLLESHREDFQELVRLWRNLRDLDDQIATLKESLKATKEEREDAFREFSARMESMEADPSNE